MPRTGIAFLLLVLAALSATVRAAVPLTSYVAYLSGYIDIAPDGSVQKYSLSRSVDLGEPLKSAVDRRIRSWRFEPVVDNGHLVIAHVLVGITLRADADANGNDLKVSFGKVQFYSTPVDDSPGQKPVMHKSPDHLLPALRPPRYPSAAMRAGVGALVELVLKLDDDGRVTEEGVRSLDMLLPRAMSEKILTSYEQEFRKATLAAAQEWIFPANYRAFCDKPCVVAVPVHYSMPGTFWSGLRSMPEAAIPWAVPQNPIVNLDPSGAPASERKLIDPGQAEGKL